jgi:hypothetical protein
MYGSLSVSLGVSPLKMLEIARKTDWNRKKNISTGENLKSTYFNSISFREVSGISVDIWIPECSIG